MKKYYWVGDIINNSGPAIVNKSYYKYLNNEFQFCKTNNKILRTLHFLFFSLNKKIILISCYSKLNYLIAYIAKKTGKIIIYLMHGYRKDEVKYENNSNKDEEIKYEYKLLNISDKIICVSKLSCNYMKKQLPEFSEKITYINNSIEYKKSQKRNKNKSDIFTIISVGGGMKIKNNLNVCKAIEKIKNFKIKFIVIGKSAEEGDTIKKYSFVEYYEKLPHEEVLKKMNKADLYIQNSDMETFGLAILESIKCGCDVLISKNIGVIDIIENINDENIIHNNKSIKEISEKIINKIIKEKKQLKISKLNSWENSSKQLLNIIEKDFLI